MNMKTEPAMIVGAVMAVVQALIVFGVFAWTPEESSAFQTALEAVLPFLLPLPTLIGAWITRGQVFSPATVEKDFVAK